jgi:glyoxylase-like metal-dependent hydrolase (beta-lactamase superfamily II)
MRTVTIGNVEITPLTDTRLLANPDILFPQRGEQFRAERPEIFDERRLTGMAITCFLVRSDGKNVLVDTGIGSRSRPMFPSGKLDESLREAGVDPGEVDIVVNTHLHIDHVGWNTVDDEQGRPRVFFPNASFWVQQAEWDHWMTPEHNADPSNSHLTEAVKPLEESGHLNLVGVEAPITADLTYIPTPGHTPGHVSIGIYSAGEKGLIAGDASHHPIQLDHPDWSPAVDSDPVQSARTREALFDRVIDEERTWLAGHWPEGIGRIIRLDGRRVFQAL